MWYNVQMGNEKQKDEQEWVPGEQRVDEPAYTPEPDDDEETD